jgi:hypothetical protein
MTNTEASNEKQNSTVKIPTFANTPQQRFQVSPEFQQQISILNARINNANLAHADLLREMDITIKALVAAIISSQQENVELKAKETPKSR